MTEPTVTRAETVARLTGALVELVRGSESMRSGLAPTLGIGITEMRALARVFESDGMSPKQLAAALELTTGAVTALTDRLVAAGLLGRLPHPSDRRSLVLRVTPTGAAMIERVGGVFQGAVDEAIEGMDLSRALDAVGVMDAIARRLVATSAGHHKD